MLVLMHRGMCFSSIAIELNLKNDISSTVSETCVVSHRVSEPCAVFTCHF